MKKLKLGIVMDPIESIKREKDSTFAMMLEAQVRNWPMVYMEQRDLSLQNGEAWASVRSIEVQDTKDQWYELGDRHDIQLCDVDVILMRKDPPFDMEYVYSTYILELAESKGVLVVNKPQSLRDANEKLFTAWFPQCIPESLITRKPEQIVDFLKQHKDVILKPPGGMGGFSIFRLTLNDPNKNVIIETLTGFGTKTVVVQKFIPEISAGDKRILLIDGEPIPYALARIPAQGETRGNLAAGGTGVGVPLSERDRWICQQVGPILKKKGLMFTGLDVIGDYLTEVNVTSPTCIRELDALYSLNISKILLDRIESVVAGIARIV